jgi:hypothetical protein
MVLCSTLLSCTQGVLGARYDEALGLGRDAFSPVKDRTGETVSSA